MVLYEVTVDVEPQLAEPFERYMRERHVPDIFATGCFRRIRFTRVSEGRFCTSYEAATQADLDRYLAEHAPRLRADFQEHVPAGARASREVRTVLQTWGE